MARLQYVVGTEDPMEAHAIGQKLGIPLNLAHSAEGTIVSGPGLNPPAPAYVAPPALPTAQAAAPAPAAYTPPPAAAAPAPAPAASPAPAAAAPHDAKDQEVLAAGWSVDAHLKPLAAAMTQKHGAQAPSILQQILAPYGATKLTLLAPKHYPAVHAAMQAQT